MIVKNRWIVGGAGIGIYPGVPKMDRVAVESVTATTGGVQRAHGGLFAFQFGEIFTIVHRPESGGDRPDCFHSNRPFLPIG